MAGSPFGTQPFGTWPVVVGTLRQSDDQDFLDGLNSVVAFEYDTKYLGGQIGRHGSAGPPDWQAVEGFEEVPCRIVLMRMATTEAANLPGELADGRVLFGQAIPGDRRNRLVFQDPTFGERYFYLMGPVRNAHQMDHHWVVDVRDRPL